MTETKTDYKKMHRAKIVEAVVRDWEKENNVLLNLVQRRSLAKLMHEITEETLETCRISMQNLTNEIYAKLGGEKETIDLPDNDIVELYGGSKTHRLGKIAVKDEKEKQDPPWDTQTK